MAKLNRKATTFLEIVFAVAILAIAMIPLFGIMSKQTKDTDKNASEAFAMNKATEILDTILDNIPFVALRQGNPGLIKIDDLPSNKKYRKYNQKWAKKMANLLFPKAKKADGGWLCQGIITDTRQIHYLATLKVEDIAAPAVSKRPETKQIGSSFPNGKPNDFTPTNDLTFAYLKNPAIISDGEWIPDYHKPAEGKKPQNELDLGSGKGVAEPQENIYSDQGIEKLGPNAEGFKNPTAARYGQYAVVSKVPYDAQEPFTHTSMKKLIIQIKWNLSPKYFTNPDSEKGKPQKIHLITIKGDID